MKPQLISGGVPTDDLNAIQKWINSRKTLKELSRQQFGGTQNKEPFWMDGSYVVGPNLKTGPKGLLARVFTVSQLLRRHTR